MLTDQQIIDKYGKPGDESNFTVIDLPYSMKLAFPPFQSVNKMRCHKLLAVQFSNIFKGLLAVYGLTEIRRLGIDLFGGCVAVRLMRGSKTKWSRHAWGIAIDLDPERNGLKVKKPKAQFSKPEYKAMIDIFYSNGFEGLGPEEDRDWMHFQSRD